jgi:transposase-like protein
MSLSVSVCLEIGSTLQQSTKNIIFQEKKVSKFIVDETQIKISKDYFWIWVAIEPIDKVILGTYISSLERNIMLIAEEFLCILYDKNKYGKHAVSKETVWYMV